MPPAKRVYKRKAPSRIPRAPKSSFRGARHTNTSANEQFARVVETVVDFKEIANATPYNLTTTLAEYVRASAVAQNYRFYRIVEVKHEWRPLYNVSQISAGGSPVPIMYNLVNTSGLEPTYFNTDWLQKQGAKPILFDKPVTVRYAPQILVPSFGSASVAPQMRGSKTWLPCFYNPGSTPGPASLNNLVEYYGSLFEVEAQGTTAVTSYGEVWTTVVVEYKEPMVVEPASPGDGITVMKN